MQHIQPSELIPEWLVDAEISIDEVDEKLMDELHRFSPFGIDNQQPLFLARNVRFFEVRKVGESRNHLRFRFRKSTGHVLSGIGFNMGKALPEDSIGEGTCDIVFSVDANDYNGMRTPQAVVQDVSFVSTAQPVLTEPSITTSEVPA